MRLGELISKLEREDQNKPVVFDALCVVPTKFDSYRGFYEDLALGFTGEWGISKTVGVLLDQCRKADGEKFSGWKGGDYLMSRNTRLWADNRGRASGFEIVAVESNEYEVVIKTERTDP